MSPASSSALKHPPVTAPSEPAGAPSDFPELAVAIDRQRRRGRGAHSNASGRFESRWSTVQIQESPAVLLRGMAGSSLGVWVAHGEGRCVLA